MRPRLTIIILYLGMVAECSEEGFGRTLCPVQVNPKPCGVFRPLDLQHPLDLHNPARCSSEVGYDHAEQLRNFASGCLAAEAGG
jgi:hypothetical protein